MSRICAALLSLALLAGCIDRGPLESRQCGACAEGEVCRDGYCEVIAIRDATGDPDTSPLDQGDSPDANADLADLEPDLPDVDDASDAPDTPCVPTGVELCDAVDNDCDGIVDNLAGIGSRCLVGMGACMREGVLECGEGLSLVCSETPGEPTEERCNGLDDDCNGVADDFRSHLDVDCEALPESSALCVDGVCTYTCHEGFADANADLSMEDSDGCECAPEPSDPCDGIDNDCDGEVDPVCCQAREAWSLYLGDGQTATDLVMAGRGGETNTVVAWREDPGIRYILLNPEMRPVGPVVAVDTSALYLRVTASSTGFALAWWDLNDGHVWSRILNMDGEVLDEAILNDALVDIDVPPRGFALTYDDNDRLIFAWSHASCDPGCLIVGTPRIAPVAVDGISHPMEQLEALWRQDTLLVAGVRYQNDSGDVLVAIIPENPDGDADVEQIQDTSGANVDIAVAPTEDGFIVAVATGMLFDTARLIRLEADGHVVRNRSIGEHIGRAYIRFAPVAGEPRIPLLHATRGFNGALRFLTVQPDTLSHNQEDQLGSLGTPDSIGMTPMADGLLVGAIANQDDLVRLTYVSATGDRGCP